MHSDYKIKSIQKDKRRKSVYKMDAKGDADAFKAQVEMFNRSRERMQKQKAGA